MSLIYLTYKHEMKTWKNQLLRPKIEEKNGVFFIKFIQYQFGIKRKRYERPNILLIISSQHRKKKKEKGKRKRQERLNVDPS